MKRLSFERKFIIAAAALEGKPTGCKSTSCLQRHLCCTKQANLRRSDFWGVIYGAGVEVASFGTPASIPEMIVVEGTGEAGVFRIIVGVVLKIGVGEEKS